MGWEKENLIWHFVEKWASKTPDSESLVFENQRLSWVQFKQEIDLISKAFIEAGVNKGDCVALLSMAQIEFLTTYMAASKIGAVWLGLNPKSTIDELRYILEDSQPTILIAVRTFMGADLSETITTLQHEIPSLKKVLIIGEAIEGTESFTDYTQEERNEFNEDLETRAVQTNADDPVLLMYTSGSTGKPKGVIHTHSSIIENIKVEIKAFEFDVVSRVLLHFPINHVAADVEIGFAAIMAGGCIVCMDSFDPAASIKMIEKERITVVGQVPVMFLLQMQQPIFKEADLSSIRLFAWAGAAAPKIMLDVLSAIGKQSGAKLITGYGSTELCGFITYTNQDDDLDTIMKSIGKIAPPFELKIVDDDRNELGPNEIGEIAVRGPFLFKSYLNKPDATAAVIDNEGWYYTDDMAYQDENGYLFITGRKSEMYKTGGENVFPREIEEVLESHPGVLFAAVIAIKDDLYQEVGWAYVMQQPGQTVNETQLNKLCEEKLTNFKIPKRFIIRPSLPLLANGKVNKVELKKKSHLD